MIPCSVSATQLSAFVSLDRAASDEHVHEPFGPVIWAVRCPGKSER
jgi:hypothetical protein